MGRQPRPRRWPWGVCAVDRRTRQPRAYWWPGTVLWLAICDCGWETVRRRRRSAATALANHTHRPPNPYRGAR